VLGLGVRAWYYCLTHKKIGETGRGAAGGSDVYIHIHRERERERDSQGRKKQGRQGVGLQGAATEYCSIGGTFRIIWRQEGLPGLFKVWVLGFRV